MKGLISFALCLLFGFHFLAAQDSADQEAEKLLEQGHALAKDGKYALSVEVLTESLKRFDLLKNRSGSIRAANLLGESFANSNECSLAISTIEKNLKYTDSLHTSDRLLLAEIYFYFGRAKGGCARQFDEGLIYLKKAAAIHKKSTSLLLASDYEFMGFIFEAKGSYDSASFYLNQSLALRKQNLPEDDVEISHPLFILAKVQDNKGNLDESLDLHRQALKIRLRHLGENHPSVSNSYHSLGLVFQKLGNYNRALDYFQKSLKIRKETLGETHTNVGASYYMIGNAYATLGNERQAIHYIEEGNRILEQRYPGGNDIYPTYLALLTKLYGKLNAHETAKLYLKKTESQLESHLKSDHPFRGIVWTLLGEYYFQLEDYSKALELYTKALPIIRKGYGNGSIREADLLSKIGSVFFQLQLDEKGLQYISSANRIFDQKLGKTNPRTAINYHQLGKYYKERAEYSRALKFLQLGFCNIAYPFNDTIALQSNPDTERMEDKMTALRIAMEKARAWKGVFSETKNYKDLDVSLLTYQYGFSLYDQILSGYTLESARKEITKDSRLYFQEAMDVAYTLFSESSDPKYMQVAWMIAEKSKSILLLANLNDQQAKSKAGVPDSLVTKEQDVLATIAHHENALYQAIKRSDSVSTVKHEEKLFHVREQYARLKKDLERQYRSYYQWRFDSHVLSIKDVQANLRKDQMIIEYFSSGNEMYAFRIDKERSEWIQLDRSRSSDNLLALYQRSLSDFNFILNEPSVADRQLRETSFQLYTYLLRPVLENHGISVNRISIIPDEKLSAINFATLITDTTQLSQDHYLLKSFDISYAYSASYLNKINSTPTTKSSFAGFAPSYLNFSLTKQDSINYSLPAVVMRDGILPLPGAEKEVQTIRELMKGMSWINEEATESNFKSFAPQYGILHLAMHSLLNNEDPERSQLLFNRELDSLNDGYLTTAEIYTLKLNASLVVLSACSSGEGKIQAGEGPVSLARAFNYAGVPSVVMSLWKVPDDVTGKIMVLFYQELKKGLNKDEALKNAQLNYLAEVKDPLYRHPFFWSGFVVMGSTEPLNSSFSLLQWILMGSVLVFLFVLLIVRRKSLFSKKIA